MATVVQNPDAVVEPEVLARSILDVSAAAKRLLNGRLKMRAICVLIKDASGGNLPLTTIEAVLRHAADLEKNYLKESP